MVHSAQEPIPSVLTMYESVGLSLKKRAFAADIAVMQGSNLSGPSPSDQRICRLYRWFQGEVLRARRRHQREHGATIVEFAIVSIGFFALVLGTIDFSMAMFEMNGVNFGTRSQARSASNGEWGSSVTCNLVPDPDLPPLDPDIKDLMCATKIKTSVASDRVRVRLRYEDPDFPTRTDVKPQKGKSIVVCTMTSIRSVSGVFGPLVKDKVITSIARSRIERDLSIEWKISGSSDTKGPLLAGISSEKPLFGGEWDFCERKPVGNEEVGTVTVAQSEEICQITWQTSGHAKADLSSYVDGDEVTYYILDGEVTNLSRDPWNAYEVTFNLPPGHIPQLVSNRIGEGNVLPGPSGVDVSGRNVWTFRKMSTALGSDYGLPLEDGDLQPGNGVSVSVDVGQGADVVKTVPTDGYAPTVRIPPPDAPSPLNPTDPFGTSLPVACKVNP
jgi:TadE-like protein